MSLSDPRQVFGVHSISPYNRTTGAFYGIGKVVKDGSISLSGALVENMGGSNRYPWAVEDGAITAEISLKFNQIEDWMFTLFLGATPSTAGVDAAGTISALTNLNGTSLMDATTGVASALVISASKANLKFGKYLVVVVSATTVDIYACSDVDFNRGSAGSYSTDLLKIAAAQTITASTATNITTYGFKLTGGSGSIGMTTGDTATFEVLPPSTKSMSVTVGQSGGTCPEFGALCYAQQRSNGEMFEVDVFRAKASGFPIGFSEKAFSDSAMKAKLLYDSTKNGVFKVRHIIPS